MKHIKHKHVTIVPKYEMEQPHNPFSPETVNKFELPAHIYFMSHKQIIAVWLEKHNCIEIRTIWSNSIAQTIKCIQLPYFDPKPYTRYKLIKKIKQLLVFS